MSGDELDSEITGAISLVGLLLVFATGYLTAAWTYASSMMRESPSVTEDKEDLKKRYETTKWVVVGALVVAATVFLLLVPLSIDVIRGFDWGGQFRTLRAGLLLTELLLISLGVAAVVLIKQLDKAKGDIE